jgi:hypothetical protein
MWHQKTCIPNQPYLETMAQLKERVAMLEMVLRKHGLTMLKLPEEE